MDVSVQEDDFASWKLITLVQTIVALVLILVPVIYNWPYLSPIRSLTAALLPNLASLESLLPVVPPSRDDIRKTRAGGLKIWRQILLVLLGLVEVAGWMAVTGGYILQLRMKEIKVPQVLSAIGMVFVWIDQLFLTLKPLLHPPSTPPYPALVTYFFLSISSLVQLGLAWFVRASTGEYPTWATRYFVFLSIGNVVLNLILISVVGGLHTASPEILARMTDLPPEDRSTLFSWLTFTWINPYIAFARSKELDETDLPKLSPSMQARIVYDRFQEVLARSLLFRLLLANRLDLFLDASMTIVSVVFNYAGPFFLKRILDGLTIGTPEAFSRAYVYAFLAFLAQSSKGVTDLLHLYYSRRASVRLRGEMSAAIYDKALRRKDASGVVAAKDKPESEAKAGKDAKDTKDGKDGKNGKESLKEGKKEEKKASADVGKVVNLMSSDINRIANTIAGLYFIYGSPIEIIVASTFLYQLLGWSAFSGIVVLVIAAPVNSFVSKRAMGISRELLAARDKRVSVMTELITAIQFIKFFAWVEKWKGRVREARNKEMSVLVRSFINYLYFGILWQLAPILVNLVTFFCYIVIAKRELTVSIAFTSIALLQMLRLPLNVLPTYIVIMLQTHVSIKRIEDFFGEEEVEDWVSSLKRSPYARSSASSKIGFENATLRWNTGKQPETATDGKKDKSKASAPQTASSSSSEDSTAVAEPEVFHLSRLNASFPIGKLSVVTGPTGSGKSAVLTALLGEMELLEGKSFLPKDTKTVDPKTGLRNSVAYAAQTPWLQQKSIKDNVLFGEELDEDRYEATLSACALVPDLDMLEDGDATEIGTKGVSLSGGQKARVALARAVYSYTQHILMDDPLAAVDSHTAKHLVDECLNGPLLKGRTVIIVSHHVELLLPSAGYIVRILDGRIDAQGTPDELKAAGELDDLMALEEAHARKEEPVTQSAEVQEEVEAAEGTGEKAGGKKRKQKEGPGKKLVKDEERAVGSVKWETYKMYIVAVTALPWIFGLSALALQQLDVVGQRYWLKLWGEAYNTQLQSLFAILRPSLQLHSEGYHANLPSPHQHVLSYSPMSSDNASSVEVMTEGSGWRSRLPSAHTHPEFYLIGWAIILLSDVSLSMLENIFSYWGQYRAAVRIHNRLLDSVVRGTIRFFNVTPVGRILNRFTRDLEAVDTQVNNNLQTVLTYAANLLSAVIVVVVIVPWFLVPAVVISYLYWRYSIVYLRVGRSLRRLESTLRSPIYSGFAELLDGIVTVRAFSAEGRFMEGQCETVDKSHSAHYYNWMMNRWLLVRFDVLGAFSVFCTTLFTLSGAVQPGSAGMAILSAQGFVSACYWTSRFWGELEMSFNSVERVQEYLEIPQEPPATIANRKPPAYWPSDSSGDQFLRVEDLEIKYAPDLPTVFKGSFEIKAGEKIGLIGRTGSGKSTLAMALLRFTDPTTGKIILDNIDITSIGVDDLRSRITYIPQDAVLFSGTIRDNLDPFGEHSDEELLEALSRVNLGPSDTPFPSRVPSRVPSSSRLASLSVDDPQPSGTITPGGRSTAGGKVAITLASDVSSGGANFSQGQRQLVAMARALLRRSNLIIMDEATASVDFATDEALQKAIRTEFKSSTLLTIAHRLSSVIDYDRLLVLSDGKVAEFDTPINLLRKDGSLFKSLCENSGKYRELYRAAEKKEAGEAH